MRNPAVITGDLIKSRQASKTQVDLAMQTLEETIHAFADHTGFDGKFTRFRGDGWQVLAPSAGQSLMLCVLLHAKLRAAGLKIDTRMSVGTGHITSTGTSSLADASGDAFERSGKGLDDIRKDRLVIDGIGVTPDQRAIFALVEHIIYGWTAPQSEAMALMLLDTDATQDDIAGTLGITRQAVQLRLAGAGKAPIFQALNAFALHGIEARMTP